MERTITTSSNNNSTDNNQTHHDFMNVDSFSQLPFIRPAKSSSSSLNIRLFGIDFSSPNTATETSGGDSGESTTNSVKPDLERTNTAKDSGGGETGSGESSSRKFECHYCCRNFPTSQALGGHQNAHKRERQNAKRAHLDHHHLYGGPHRPPPNPNYLLYPSSSNYYNTTRFSNYNYNYNNPQPPPTINGSPLSVWRVPPAIHCDRTPRLFAGSVGNDHSVPRGTSSGSFVSSMGSVMGSSNAGFDHGQQFKRAANGRDKVSLDLHL